MDKFNFKNVAEATASELSSSSVKRTKTYLFQWIVCLMIVCFAILTFLVVTIPTFSIDLDITLGLQAIKNASFNGLMHSISWVGFGIQAYIIAFVILMSIYLLGFRWEAVASLIAALGSKLLNLVVKELVGRVRPSADLVQVSNLLDSYSFPSGHVMYYTGFFGFICFLTFTLLKPSWQRTLLLILFGGHVVLVGLSRIYLGEHWASDVVAAYLLGGLCLIAIIELYRWGKPRFFNQQTTGEI